MQGLELGLLLAAVLDLLGGEGREVGVVGTEAQRQGDRASASISPTVGLTAGSSVA